MSQNAPGFVIKTGVEAREIRALRAIRCLEGVMPMCRAVLEDGSHALLMPQCVCVASLKGRLGENQRLKLGRTLANVLTRIHKRGVLHCDVKPHNLFLGSGGNPIIGDFGSAEVRSMLKENEKQRFNGTSMFAMSRSAPPSALRDFQSLCLSLHWLSKPWMHRNEMPRWETVVEDPVVATVWKEFGQHLK